MGASRGRAALGSCATQGSEGFSCLWHLSVHIMTVSRPRQRQTRREAGRKTTGLLFSRGSRVAERTLLHVRTACRRRYPL
jgi:hypothetical protein